MERQRDKFTSFAPCGPWRRFLAGQTTASGATPKRPKIYGNGHKPHARAPGKQNFPSTRALSLSAQARMYGRNICEYSFLFVPGSCSRLCFGSEILGDCFGEANMCIGVLHYANYCTSLRNACAIRVDVPDRHEYNLIYFYLFFGGYAVPLRERESQSKQEG